MALFTVNRYLGDEADDSEEELKLEDAKVDPLAKLKADALKRKAEREAEEKKAKKLKKSRKKDKIKKKEEETPPTPIEDEVTAVKQDEDVKSDDKTDLVDDTEEKTPDASSATRPSISGEIGGFTILSAAERQDKDAVDRVLPEWLSKPSVIPVDLSEDASLIVDDPSIDDRLKASLRRTGILHFFPVQRRVVPFLLSSLREQTLYLNPGFLRPNDICVSAPTGSGKTLAFVVPILQALSHRLVVHTRALVVLPVKDLAVQVSGLRVYMTRFF